MSVEERQQRFAEGARARLARLEAVAAMSRASVAAAGEAAAGDSGPAGADLVVKVPELLLVCVEAGDGDDALDELLTDLLEAGEGDEPVDGEGGEDGERGSGEEAQAHLVLGGVPVDAAAGTSLDARMAEPAAGPAHARRSDELDRTAEAPRMAVLAVQVARADGVAAERAEADELTAELARLARRDTAAKAAAEAGRTWSELQDAPPAATRREAVAPKPSRKSQRYLVSVTKLWHLWRAKCLATDGAEIARAGGKGPTWDQVCCRAAQGGVSRGAAFCDPDPNPNSNQVYLFLRFTSGYRRRASLQTGLKMRGLSERTLKSYVSSLTKHVLPTLYPQMVDPSVGGMGRDGYRAFGNDLLAAVRNFFCEAGQEELGLQVQQQLLAAAAQAAGLGAAAAAASHATPARALVAGLFDSRAPNTGSVSSAVAAVALAGGREAAEGRRAQTAHPQTKKHAVPQDLELMADVSASVPFSRNAALVFDAYQASVVCSGLRPTSAGLSRSVSGLGFGLGLCAQLGLGAGAGAGAAELGLGRLGGGGKGFGLVRAVASCVAAPQSWVAQAAVLMMGERRWTGG